jgi:hypothetical protein
VSAVDTGGEESDAEDEERDDPASTGTRMKRGNKKSKKE